MIGVFGYLLNTGIGSLIKDIKKFLPVDRHIVLSHSRRGIDHRHWDDKCVVFNPNEVDKALDGLKSLVIIEHPLVPGLLSAAHARGINVICVVDVDWFYPKDPEWQYVTTFVCPNELTRDRLLSYGRTNVQYIPCSVDTDEFAFKKRGVANKFLFNNGWGGVNGRKGYQFVKRVFERLDIPVVVHSQVKVSMRPLSKQSVIVVDDVKDRSGLYADGDVYLAPSSWEGCGLHIVEAMACGLPVLTTNGRPMNEYVRTPEFLCAVAGSRFRISSGSRFTPFCHYLNPRDFQCKVRKLFLKDVSAESIRVREVIEQKYSWQKNKSEYEKLLG